MIKNYALAAQRCKNDPAYDGKRLEKIIENRGLQDVITDIRIPVETVTVVKNCRDYLILRRKNEQLFYDYRQEQETDCYYLRVKLQDGRLAWTSPIWVRRA